MKIKIIDLLNMKSSCKKMPSKICYDKRLWLLTDDGIDYGLEDKIDEIWLFQDYIPNNFDLLCALNDEVEIIEEEKEIEKIDISENTTNRNERYIRKCDNEFLNLSQANYYLAQKINELVDEVNKLKKEK